MDKTEMRKIIKEQVEQAFDMQTSVQNKNKMQIIEMDFDGSNSWIDYIDEEGKENSLKFEEHDFANWVSKNEDISEFIEKDHNYDNITKKTTPYSYFNYRAWKEYNNPKDLALDFLVYKLGNK